jgi:site-specific recombinase XerD
MIVKSSPPSASTSGSMIHAYATRIAFAFLIIYYPLSILATGMLPKVRKDRVAFASPTTAEAIRRHLAMRPGAGHSNPLFADAQDRPLTPRHLVQILHRLSARAGLPANRRLHPHTLRHFAASSWLRNGVGLDHVRRLFGHTSVAMTLRYSSLVAADLQRAHREAAAIERVVSGGSPRRGCPKVS